MGALRSSHASPRNPGKHAQKPSALHMPLPEQRWGQSATAQLSPCQARGQKRPRKVIEGRRYGEGRPWERGCVRGDVGRCGEMWGVLGRCPTCQPWKHVQLPSTQWPWPEQPSGHADSWQPLPVHPCSQLHSPVTWSHTPRPLHWDGEDFSSAKVKEGHGWGGFGGRYGEIWGR